MHWAVIGRGQRSDEEACEFALRVPLRLQRSADFEDQDKRDTCLADYLRECFGITASLVLVFAMDSAGRDQWYTLRMARDSGEHTVSNDFSFRCKGRNLLSWCLRVMRDARRLMTKSAADVVYPFELYIENQFVTAVSPLE